LDFSFLGTRVIVIENPHDSPLDWRYEVDSIALTDADTNLCTATFVDNDQLYLVGNIKGGANILTKISLAMLEQRNFKVCRAPRDQL
jgi:hypothetical protein